MMQDMIENMRTDVATATSQLHNRHKQEQTYSNMECSTSKVRSDTGLDAAIVYDFDTVIVSVCAICVAYPD